VTVRKAWRRATSPRSWRVSTRRVRPVVAGQRPLWIGWLAALVVAKGSLGLWKPLREFLCAPPAPLPSSHYGTYYSQAVERRPLALVDRDAA